MLLEFLIFLLSSVTLLSILLDSTARSRKLQDEGPKNKSKVVSLGYIQSAIWLVQCLLHQRTPNYEISQRVGKEYGNIVIIHNPFKRQVMVNITEWNAARSVMNATNWADRFPSDYYFHKYFEGIPVGTFFASGGWWKEGRKMTLKLLHQFGFFREETVEQIVRIEAADLCEKEFSREVQQQGGKVAVMSPNQVFQIYTLNIIYQVVVGKRFQRGDPTAQKLLKIMNASNREFKVGTDLLDIFPWLARLPFLKFHTTWTEFNQTFKDHFRQVLIEPRRKDGSYKTNPVDFGDFCLLEMDKSAKDEPCFLTETNFYACMRDLMSGASDTVNSSLEHGILHVCLQPEIQRRVQDEIDQVIGSKRQPCYEDRKLMPYTEATLWEILRFATPAGAVSRCPFRDGEIEGTMIPRDSLVGINLYAIHHSKEMWSDPDDFRPERFLNEKSQLTNLDKIMPFGYGKRVCIGEFPAKISFFIFFVSMLQKFTFELSKEHGPPNMRNTIGLSHGPLPFYVKVAHRYPVQTED